MAPIIPPKHESDFLRPQMQDGQPAAISHSERPSGLSSAIEIHPTTDAMSPEKRGEKPPHQSLAQHVEANFWGSIFGGPEAVQREKVKRKEGFLDPETTEIAEALAKEFPDAPGATESTIIRPSTPFVVGELAEQSLGTAATESKIVDPSIPMVTDTLAEQSLKLDSTMESKATSKPRPNHHSMRECAHGGRMSIPRMRGHGGRPRKPKSQENPEGKDPKGKNGRLARRLDFPGAMASVPSSVLCHFPSMKDTWICPKVKAREAEPAGGGAAVLPAVMAATGWAGTGMIGVHGGPTQITFEEGGLSTGWILAIVLAAGIVALCLICGLRWCLKRRSRRRALRLDEAEEDAVVVELQEMKGVQLERDERKC